MLLLPITRICCVILVYSSVTGPSRVTDTSSTLIDHIVSTPVVSMLSVKQAIGLSDHRVQIADIDVVVQ